MDKIPVITIDGPSGSGKGTISQLLAKKLQWHLLDSGALYRVLALAAEQHSVAYDNNAALIVLAAHLDVQFDEHSKILLEGHDVTQAIRTVRCGNAASIISAIPEVRIALVERQHNFREPPGLIADGRDMGSVIFPDAKLKIFLIANLEVRAQRRLDQLQNQGINDSLERISAELIARDQRDTHRTVSPLKPAAEAIIIDTTFLTIEEVVTKIMQAFQAKTLETSVL